MKKLSCISFILVLFMVGCDDAAEPEITIEDDPFVFDSTFSEIASDPAGDMVRGAAPDIISLHVKRTSTHIVFRAFFAEDVDMDSAGVVLSLDVDRNPNTGTSQFAGLNGAWDIGADYDVLAVLPSYRPQNNLLPPLSLQIFHNPNGTDLASTLTDAVSAEGNMIEFAVPLSELGNSDHNMHIVGFSAYGAQFQTLDYIPNTGHMTVTDDRTDN